MVRHLSFAKKTLERQGELTLAAYVIKRDIRKGTKLFVLALLNMGMLLAIANLPTLKPTIKNWFSDLRAEPKISAEKAARLDAFYRAAGQKYDVPWELLKAINKVETNFGQNTGKYRVLDVLRTSERDAFYQICSDKRTNPSSVKGSRAGAIGFMQFMPSTWQKYKDASGKPPYDPWDDKDSIFAAAKLLAENGGKEEIYRAIWNYNPDPGYVDEVTNLAVLYSKDRGPSKNLGNSSESETGSSITHTDISQNEELRQVKIPNLADVPNLKPSDIKIDLWANRKLDFGKVYRSIKPSCRKALLFLVLFMDKLQNETTETIRTNVALLIDGIEARF